MKDVGEQAALDLLTKGWDGFLAGPGRGLLEQALPAWLKKQRWFGAKTRVVSSLAVAHWAQIPVAAAGILNVGLVPSASTLGDALLLVELRYADGSSDRYQVPLGYATGEALTRLRAAAPASLVLEVETPTGPAAFHDAAANEELRQALLGLVEHGQTLAIEDGTSASEAIAATLVAAHESRPAHEISAEETQDVAARISGLHSIETSDVAPAFVGHMPGAQGGDTAAPTLAGNTSATLRGSRSDAFAAVRGVGPLPSRVGSVEQSNTNVIYGNHLLLKVFRRLQPGLNPDVEIGRFLTEVAHFPRIAPFLGELTLTEADGTTTLAMLQGLVANEGDGWAWTLASLARYYDSAEEATLDEESVASRAGRYVQNAELLGRRTAEMHLALATATDDNAFAAEAFTPADLERDAARVEAQIVAALDALESIAPELSGGAATQARAVLARRSDLLQRARLVAGAAPSGERIRIHGDYHLGQILRADGDFVLLDFEGEPAKSLAERRAKQSPLRDVAGMLRSFSYAAYSGLDALAPDRRDALAPWAKAWETAVSAAFLRGYGEAAQASQTLLPGALEARELLNAYLLEKALYELLYELNNRPAWVPIPLSGILALL